MIRPSHCFNRYRSYLLTALALLLTSAAPAVSAQSDAPDVMIKKLTDDVLAIVRQDKDIKSGNTQKAIALVEERVLPIFNFPHMTALALGKSWRKASPEQKTALTQQFKTLLVRTYAGSLAKYSNQTIVYKPLKLAEGGKEAKLALEIRDPGKQNLQLEYSLEKIDSGWKVYDVVAENVSMIVSYRDGFNQTVDRVGIDGLLAELSDKNRSLGEEARKTTKK